MMPTAPVVPTSFLMNSLLVFFIYPSSLIWVLAFILLVGIRAWSSASPVANKILQGIKCSPAEPGSLRLLAPERELIATGEKQKQLQQQRRC